MRIGEKIAAVAAVCGLFLMMLVILALMPRQAGALAPKPTKLPPELAPTSEALSGLPSCFFRVTYRPNPWITSGIGCVETVIEDRDGGLLGFTALATAPDGTLYAARPLTGQVFALDDTDGDGLPDSPRVVADGLTLPNGLDFAGGALYIAGGARIDRLADGKIETLVDDLPSGSGFWTGGIAVGPDDRLYVSTGAACDACAGDDPARGAILSFDMHGGDRRIVATGLREPADLAFAGTALWTLDSARDGLANEGSLDELNRVSPDANFGFPFCIGADNRPDLDGGDCSTVTAPALTFATHSHPVGLAAYRGGAVPVLENSLLVVLAGTVNQPFMQGYELVAVALDQNGDPQPPRRLIPGQSAEDSQQFTLQEFNYRTSGFWPRRPLDVAVNEQGWIYVSVGDGLILGIRPL